MSKLFVLLKNLVVGTLIIWVVIGVGAWILKWDSNYTGKLLIMGTIFIAFKEIYVSFSNKKDDNVIKESLESTSSRKRFFENRTILIGLLIAVSIIIYLAYSASKATSPVASSQLKDWTAQEKTDLTEACQKQGNAKFCDCYITYLTSKYTFDEVEKMVQQSKETNNTSKEIKDAVSACVSN